MNPSRTSTSSELFFLRLRYPLDDGDSTQCCLPPLVFSVLVA
uniref:Uncharacterized protein n=1 Tax=Anguilla anguilla TaxID=7936 RepID=A0A0E9WFM1_ANGAN